MTEKKTGIIVVHSRSIIRRVYVDSTEITQEWNAIYTPCSSYNGICKEFTRVLFTEFYL